jgi:hypothetical protein
MPGTGVGRARESGGLRPPTRQRLNNSLEGVEQVVDGASLEVGALDRLFVSCTLGRRVGVGLDAPSLNAPPASLARRWIELGVLYVLGPALMVLVPRWGLSLAILASGAGAAIALLADPTFPRRQLWGAVSRRALAGVLLRTALVAALVLTFVLARAPSRLFELPRSRPVVWAAVMLLYPVSAYAQELFCRTFFFHRYGSLFARSRTRILVNAALFGWAHVAVENALAVVLAAAIGLIFASSYERWRSTLLVSLEHALYGDIAFTLGLGSLFYSTVRWHPH